ncbi:hypothetical protein ARALYDRAFT_915134 [Arabidopsis lyrata subsp. lyrata]|uniref:GDSL-motif lipase/hydrolase family protein n=1 Tax=Arabidopsis lyrata subsp. lyrata TaxID=81972 RepID=D7M9X8_ARALL|nr:hypothetical protein ARALYDRAFT_915134 [Arabidopsis lyrata subsp. lyrata]
MIFGGNYRAQVFVKQHGWTDDGNIESKYTSRAVEESDEARKRFSNAKSISSAQFFGDEMKSAGRDESETTLEGKNDFWSLVNKAACEVKEKLLSKSNHHQDKVNDLRREVTILMEILHAQDADAIPLVTRQNWAHLLCTEAYKPDTVGLVRRISDQALGSDELTPPYLAPTTSGSLILDGVNYASGGSGILNSTGKLFGERINVDAQLDNFATTRQDIISWIGDSQAAKLFRSAIFSVTTGSNDLINNYFTPVVSTLERKVSPEVFVDTMISKFRLQLTRLYQLGARKIVVINIGPIGCIPFERESDPTAGDECSVEPNEVAQMYNIKLKTLLEDLNKNLQGSRFVYADVFRIVYDILQNYSILREKIPCCSLVGKVGGLIPCGPSSKVCMDRSKYV